MRGAAKLFAPVVSGEVRVFRDKELEAAKAWVAEAPAG